jgi:hypothetical protein
MFRDLTKYMAEPQHVTVAQTNSSRPLAGIDISAEDDSHDTDNRLPDSEPEGLQRQKQCMRVDAEGTDSSPEQADSLDLLWDELDVHDQAHLTGSDDPGRFDVELIDSALGSHARGGDGVDLTDALLLDILSDTPVSVVAKANTGAVRMVENAGTSKKARKLDLNNVRFEI